MDKKKKKQKAVAVGAGGAGGVSRAGVDGAGADGSRDAGAPGQDGREQMEDLGVVSLTRGPHAIHCLTVIGQVEGHVEAPQGQKTTKYEHVIPQLVAVQEDPAIEGLLVLLNTVGGDVEAGLALAELISSISKPSATLVLGGGHSIGIPLAVSAKRSFIVPTATMTVHPPPSWATRGMVRRVSPPAVTTSSPSFCPASTGASTASVRRRSVETWSSRAFSTRMRLLSPSTGWTVSDVPRETATGGMA